MIDLTTITFCMDDVLPDPGVRPDPSRSTPALSGGRIGTLVHDRRARPGRRRSEQDRQGCLRPRRAAHTSARQAAALVETLVVDYYGTRAPLRQAGRVQRPRCHDARRLALRRRGRSARSRRSAVDRHQPGQRRQRSPIAFHLTERRKELVKFVPAARLKTVAIATSSRKRSTRLEGLEERIASPSGSAIEAREDHPHHHGRDRRVAQPRRARASGGSEGHRDEEQEVPARRLSDRAGSHRRAGRQPVTSGAERGVQDLRPTHRVRENLVARRYPLNQPPPAMCMVLSRASMPPIGPVSRSRRPGARRVRTGRPRTDRAVDVRPVTRTGQGSLTPVLRPPAVGVRPPRPLPTSDEIFGDPGTTTPTDWDDLPMSHPVAVVGGPLSTRRRPITAVLPVVGSETWCRRGCRGVSIPRGSRRTSALVEKGRTLSSRPT